jgi:hypothetical protein
MTEMDIVVGVAPTPKLSLETELRLIKPALLYGDRVTLYSPATSLIAMTAAIGELSDDERVDFIAQVVPAVSPDRSEETLLVLNTYRELRRTRRRAREQILLVERLRRQLDVAWDMIRERQAPSQCCPPAPVGPPPHFPGSEERMAASSLTHRRASGVVVDVDTQQGPPCRSGEGRARSRARGDHDPGIGEALYPVDL